MAIDGVSSQQREVELAKRLLREREQDHAREAEKLHQSQEEQLQQLRKSQQDTISRITEKSTKDYERQREDLTKKMNDLSDQYERTLAEERRSNYDRTGRIIEDNARQKAIDKQIRSEQIHDLLESHRSVSNADRDEGEQRVKDLNSKYNDSRAYFSRYTDSKLDEMRDANRRALVRSAEEARQKVDANIRSNSEQLNLEKLGAEARFRRLTEQSIADREKLKKATDIREQQLVDEKGFLERKLGAEGSRALEQYRERAADSLAKSINDNNMLNSRREQENSERIARQENAHQALQQQRENQFRKVESEYKYENEHLRNRNELQRELDNRRHKQELFLTSEGMRNQEESVRDSMKNRFTGKLEELEGKNNTRFREYQSSVQRKMSEQELRNAMERNYSENLNASELTKRETKHAQEKLNISSSYEEKIKAAEDLRRRQLEDQTVRHQGDAQGIHEDSSRKIADANRENQTRIFLETMRFRDQLDEAKKNNEIHAFAVRESADRQSKKLMSAYQKSLGNQKNQFDEATVELKRESLINMTKQKNDADHQNRMGVLDLQLKNRLLLTQMEDKINRLSEDHQAEVERLNSEHEKAIRENNRRNKELIDTEKMQHDKDNQVREQQAEMKLKQQEAFFRGEIEKLRRTHELAIKKS